MKLLTEYLERAVNLERLAYDEQDLTFKAQLQAAAYRKLQPGGLRSSACRRRALRKMSRRTLTMSTVAGYTICFAGKGVVRQITMALDDDAKIEERLVARFGEIKIISRAGVDARGLHLLRLKPGEWVEWVPSASKPASWTK